MMEDILSWDEICEKAPLEAKNTAKNAIRNMMIELGHPDPDTVNASKDYIGVFCRKLKVTFNENGYIASFKLPFWMETLVYTIRNDSYLKQDIGYMAEDIADLRNWPLIKISDEDMEKMIYEFCKHEDNNISRNTTLENAVMAVLGERFEQVNQKPYAVGEIADSFKEQNEQETGGVFEYQGYHFKAIGIFPEEATFKEITSSTNSHADPYLADCEDAEKPYTHEDFYEASNVKDADIFRCIETGTVLVPGEHELFEYFGHYDPYLTETLETDNRELQELGNEDEVVAFCKRKVR